MTLELIFFLFLFYLLYVYIGYPLLLAIAGRFSPITSKADTLPSVTLFIPAHNERSVIESKIVNSLALDYPKDKLEIVIAGDGCTDDTIHIAKSYRDHGVVVYEGNRRGGKNHVINTFAPRCTGEIIVFTDANAFYDTQAVNKLVRHFAEERVGCVAGKLRYAKSGTSVGKGEGIYFRYEALLKKLEGQIGVVVAANGAIYAIRKSLFAPVDPAVPNDFFHPLHISARGYRGVFESDAIAVEQPTTSPREEYRRRIRIVTRSFNTFLRYRRELSMLRGRWGFCFLSHKLLRWFSPLAILGLLATNAWLASPFFLFTWYSQLAFYALAMLAPFLRGRATTIVSVPFYFCLINLAGLMGIWNGFFGKHWAIWDVARTTR